MSLAAILPLLRDLTVEDLLDARDMLDMQLKRKGHITPDPLPATVEVQVAPQTSHLATPTPLAAVPSHHVRVEPVPLAHYDPLTKPASLLSCEEALAKNYCRACFAKPGNPCRGRKGDTRGNLHAIRRDPRTLPREALFGVDEK